MRRNYNTNRGGGGGGGSSSNMSGAPSPFLSDHLKDIDLELDLLKRKREMIERQQQHMIQPLIPPQRNFSQQPFYQLEPKPSGSDRDFSHLYNDGSQQYRKPFGKKRQPDNDWQHNSYPKRSTGQGQRGPSYSNAEPTHVRNQRPIPQSRSTPYNYGRSKQSVGQKIVNQRQQRPAQTVVANKVTKPKAHVPPNKLAAQPIADRNKLVTAAIKSVAVVETRDREALRLHPDKVPTKQMTGRLELALGAILRDVRDKCAENSHHELLRSTALQRVIKQAIRERIRSAMLGKVVGATQETVKEYRDMYPKNTDIEIVNIALEAGGVKPETNPQPIDVAKNKPEEYFKQKMFQLINSHLNEMFDKLGEVYSTPEKEGETSQGVTADENKENEQVGDKIQKTDAATIEGNVAAASTEETTASDNEAAKGASGDAENATAVNGESVKANTEIPATVTNGNNEDAKPNVVLPYAEEYKLMLPRLLKRHIPSILKLLYLNKMYKRSVTEITAASIGMFEEYNKKDSGFKVDNPEMMQNFTVPYVVLPYYVKVMGKPQLPKKKVMHTFLDVFHPKSIKKHRTIHNLLFIGFSDKEDFDGMIAADGTVIGRSTLSIRVCDKTPGRNDDTGVDQNVSQNVVVKQEVLNDSATDLLGTELDGQITDLLTSIKEDKLDNSESETQQDETADDENAADEIAAVENAADENAADENAADENAADENAADENAADENAADENVADENETTVDNVDEVLENIEEVDEAAQNGDSEKVENNAESQATQPAGGVKTDQVSGLKNTTGRATPTRASARVANTPATPSTIRTRRASRQVPN